ncbi:MAG: A24 family peptidase [Castellaniella sp.]|uniref:prepilin peptidase n=1 Tax=Castellaniella sp. TaxID=1955812 RepID=UPI002A35B45C|nr:A24 family peptidase [Castellaniella sp.]MDY0308620.1 A24 family peptidase [Castellaniella sp.]
MGCGTLAGWVVDGWFQGAAYFPGAAAQDVAGWGVCGLAAVAGGWAGVWLGPWVEAYASRLDAGAPATARTLWGAAAVSLRPGSERRVRDSVAAVLLGLAAGLLAAGGGFGFVPLLIGLAALAWIDVRTGLLPDALTLPLMVAGWLLGCQDLVPAVGASVLVWVALAWVARLYCRLRGQDGFGGGDVKCLAVLAGWLGLEAAIGILWVASLLGLFWGLGQRGGWRQPYPFGPCIALAAWAWMLIPQAMGLAVQS